MSRQHIELAYKIYGKDLNIIKGKSKSKKPSKIRVKRVPESIAIERRQELSGDIMFVEGGAFVLSVSQPIGLAMVKHLGQLKTKDIRTAACLVGPLSEQLDT